MMERSRDLRRERKAVAAVLGLALAAALSAPALKGAGGDDVVLALRDKVVRDLSSQGVTLAFRIGVTNEERAGLELVRYRYRVTVDQKEYFQTTVELPEPIPVPSGKETLIALPVKFTYDLLFATVGPLENRAVCDIVGDMYFQAERGRTRRAPFAYSGEFPIFKEPEVVILPLQVNDLTVGGADVVFSVVFRNPNPYELLADRISCRISFSGLETFSGEIPGDKSLPSNADKVFTLPFLVDFFEAGEAMREAFAKPELVCRFEGEIRIASAWGPLNIRFEKTQTLSIRSSEGGAAGPRPVPDRQGRPRSPRS